MLVEREIPGQIAAASASLNTLTLRIEAEQRDASACGTDEVEQDSDGGRLASAVGAEEAEHRALWYLEVDRIERAHSPVVLLKAFETDRWNAHQANIGAGAPTARRDSCPARGDDSLGGRRLSASLAPERNAGLRRQGRAGPGQ